MYHHFKTEKDRDMIARHLNHKRQTWILKMTLRGILYLKFKLNKMFNTVLLSNNHTCVFPTWDQRNVGFSKAYELI